MQAIPDSLANQPATGDPALASQASKCLPSWVAALLIGALIFGVVARLIWVDDMEWKADEIYSVEKSKHIIDTGEWPATGMPTSVGLPNPGLSVWAFAPFVALDATPTGVCRQVMLLNVLALLGFAAMAVWSAENPNGRAGWRLDLKSMAYREVWLWGVALLAVNPYCVRVARKIWPPSLLCAPVLLLWFGHSRRNTRIGALVWGFAGATMGQIHLSGFFLAGGVFFLSLFEIARGRDQTKTRWLWWIAGSSIGAVGLLSFLQADWPAQGKPPSLGWTLDSFRLRTLLFSKYWLETALGVTYWESDFLDNKIHMLGVLRRCAVVLGVWGVASWAAARLFALLPKRRQRAARTWGLHRLRRFLARRNPAQAPYWRIACKITARLAFPPAIGSISVDDEARFYARAAFLAGGILLIMACQIIHLHYLLVFSPFLFVWVALVMQRRRRMLAFLVLAQAFFTATNLFDVRMQGTIPLSDYGTSYRSQQHEPR